MGPVHPRPQAGLAEIVLLRHGDEARARRFFSISWDRIFQIAENDVDLADELRHTRPHFLDMRRHEVDHALEPDRQLAQRRRRSDRKRLEKIWRGVSASLPLQRLL